MFITLQSTKRPGRIGTILQMRWHGSVKPAAAAQLRNRPSEPPAVDPAQRDVAA
eukprot:gene11704-biopygen2993